MFCRILALVALAGAAYTSPVLAQAVKATIVGNITDTSSAAIAGATVTVTEKGSGLTRTAATNESGYYALANVDAGVYRIVVEQQGFKRSVIDGLDVLPNTTARADFALELGAVTESVSVSASAALLQTDRVDIGRKIETRQLQDMPLSFNRNYQGLLTLVPGVSRPFKANSDFYNSQDSLSVNVNGQVRQGNNFQLEGLDNNWDDGNVTVLVPPIEALATVDVSTSNFDAEFGRATGAVTNVTLRSGTNEMHGSAFAFNRVSALAARNYFATTKPPVTYNLFGGTFGGRIIRNKTFIFGDYQGLRDNLGSTNLMTIPSAPFRTGDLSASTSTIYDPATGDANGRGRLPFAGKLIPGSRISPISRKILDMIPAPTRAGTGVNFESNSVRTKSTEMFDVKLDHQFSPRDNFFFRYSFQNPTLYDPPLYSQKAGGPRGSGFAGDGKARIQSPGLNYTRVFSPTLVSEVRAGIMRIRNDAYNADYGLQTGKELGIPNANIDDWSSGIPYINIDGYSNPVVGYVASLPWLRAQTNFNIVNIWNKTAGNHLIKFGVDIRRERNDLLQTQSVNPRGRFGYTAGPTSLNGDSNTTFANAFGSFLLDQASAVGRDLYVLFPTRRQLLAFSFINDKWQVTPKLTIDLGLRHEYWPTAKPAGQTGYVNFDAFNNTLLVGGYGNIPSDLGVNPSAKTFAPRFGLSYRANQRMVVRAGYGISYLFRRSSQLNFPSSQINTIEPLNSYVPAGSMAIGLPAPEFVQIPSDGIIRNAPLNQSFTVMPKDLTHGYVQSWNFAVQQTLPGNFVLETAYVGNHGVGLPTSYNLNAGLVPGAGAAGQPLNILYGRRASTSIASGSSTNYHSLQTKFDRRFAAGFMLTTAYTFSKAIDYCSDRDCGMFNQINWRENRARSDFDRTHIFTQSFILELPFGKGKKWITNGIGNHILGGWQTNGVLSLQSGAPINITFAATTLNAPFNSNRPNVTGTIQKPGLIGAGAQYLDPAAFTAPTPATFGNLGRNVVTGPGLVNLDLSLFRKFAIHEKAKLEVRFETFNFANTPQFNNPGSTFGTPTFGQVTTSGSARVVQLGAKIAF